MDENGNWQDMFSEDIRAEVTGLNGSAYFAAEAPQAGTVKNFRVRYNSTLARMNPREVRVLYAGLPYDVKTIDDFEERHIELVLRTEANYGRQQSDG